MMPDHLARVRPASTRSRRATRRAATPRCSATLENWLCEITGFAAVSLQPNAGSQGEYAGLLAIRALSRAPRRGAPRRVPDPGLGARHEPRQRRHGRHEGRRRSPATPTATSTSPTSAAKAEEHSTNLGALMVTYPSTHGVFEEGIKEICAIVHEHGGQVYMDGANMNAQVGLSSPGRHRRRRLPPQPAQDLLHPARRRRPGHGPDRRRGAPGAVPARATRSATRLGGPPRDRPGLGRAVRQREHPAHLLDVHRDDGREGPHARHRGRDPQRQLHGQRASKPHYPRALHGQARARARTSSSSTAPVREVGAASRSTTSRSA